MKKEHEHHSDESIDLLVYVALLTLTVATLAAGVFSPWGRLMAVAIALIIASMKASFIGYYYMGLRRERALPWILLAIGAAAVGILMIGLLPDMTFSRF